MIIFGLLLGWEKVDNGGKFYYKDYNIYIIYWVVFIVIVSLKVYMV